MSIISRPARVVPNQAAQSARVVRSLPSKLTNDIISGLNRGLDAIWEAKDPAAVLAEIGTDAAEAFQISHATVQFLSVVLAGKRQAELDAILAKVAAIPAFTVQQDGTVTLD